MQYMTGTTQVFLSHPSAVTIGKFDGVHRGHARLIQALLEKKKQGLKTVVVTFAMSPVGLLTEEERCERLSALHVDMLVEYPFSDELCHMEPETFLKDVLLGQLKAKYIAAGEDCRFGYQRKGNGALLKKLAPKLGYTVDIFPKEQEEGIDISSTRIREALSRGQIELMNCLLGYQYRITGSVVHGYRMGRTFGFPTINQTVEEGKLLPPKGVYVTRTTIEGVSYQSVTNVGCKPTIEGERKVGVETHLVDVTKNFYGKTARVEFLHYLRPEMKFDSKEALISQMQSDISNSYKFFTVDKR